MVSLGRQLAPSFAVLRRGLEIPAIALLALADRWRARTWRALACNVAAVAAVVLPYVAWRRAYFGAWLPNTSVKVYPLHFDRSVPQAAGFLGYLGVALLVLPPLWWRWGKGADRDRARLGRLWLAGSTLAFGFHFLAGGDYRPGFRYALAPLPLLLVAGWGALERWVAAARPPLCRWAVAALAASLVLPSAVLWWRDPWKQFSPHGIAYAWTGPFEHDTARWGVGPGWWILRNVPDGAWVAYGQMGKTPYLVTLKGRDVRFIDTVGWVDREVASIYRFDRKVGALFHALARGEGPSSALRRLRDENAEAFAQQILRRRPDFVLAERDLVHAGVDKLVASPVFRREYEEILVDPWGDRARVFARRPPIGAADHPAAPMRTLPWKSRPTGTRKVRGGWWSLSLRMRPKLMQSLDGLSPRPQLPTGSQATGLSLASSAASPVVWYWNASWLFSTLVTAAWRRR